jgi:peptidoglycan/xylan/chitin deacetylase (PgdA/CDA1 family)
MFPRIRSLLTATLLLATAAATLAGPVTTVPWNGYPGAVSFTYDDGRQSQLTNLVPQLDQLGVKVTFFLAGNLYNFSSNKSQWAALAKKGHELANHTSDHTTPNSTNVSSMATTLRGLDTSVQAVTLAYPNCTEGGTSYVGAENFMARGCSSTVYSWGTQPSDWMNIQGLIVTSSNISPVATNINSAKSGNSWAVIINHDVTTSNSDVYYLTPTDNQTMLNNAISAKVWIAPYATVGAYWRAHFSMDAVTASGTTGPWTLTWTSPHPKMPKSVKLKIKLAASTFGDSAVVVQGGTAIPRNSDSSYTIEFMKLSMTVSRKSATTGLLQDGTIPASIRTTSSGLVLSGLPSGSYTLDLRSLSGALLSRTAVRSTGQESVTVPLAVHDRQAVAVLSREGARNLVVPVWMP